MSDRATALSHPDKVLFPGAGLTKRDLADYYERIAPTMLPHLEGRPLTLQRYPDGIDAEGFFQKDVSGDPPPAGRLVEISLREGRTISQIVVEDTDALVSLANRACVTLHPWLSTWERLEHPRLMVVDLDPPRADRFDLAQHAAEDARSLLAELGLESLVMTTGSKGLHVVVPLDGEWTFDPVRELAQSLVAELARQAPERYTTEQRKHRRGERLYLDVGRNAYGQTAVAPYSPRALSDAPVATPLDWDEARSARMWPQKYGIRNVLRRLGQREDPWLSAGVGGQSLERAAHELER